MRDPIAPDQTRRRILRTIAAAPLIWAFPSLFGAACNTSGNAKAASGSTGTSGTSGVSPDMPASAPSLAVTPACSDGDDDETTVSQTEGPFFKTNSPQRASLVEAGTKGTPLAVSGLVLTRSCKPVANALIEFWQADDSGNYDNETFRLRGHQFTDARGSYRLETIIPGRYPGRTPHIHVKVQAASNPVLTTQLYFPGDPGNSSDRIFHPSLVMAMGSSGSQRRGEFNFVLDLA